ncbi:endocuticle structural glycoprotein SgAbd-2-like [Phlebotomus papatasi]|uniref:endocuticle structural glycoprotein SgAbd-2-like n=1 Tax=Phlebotomus papatasi TaxID=29031 RepID=UPI0024844E77|nr:endocuticle structural glycoprotein SgAbd-2-like [Phlebotomus papatasi]
MKVFLGLFAMMMVAAAAGEYQQQYHHQPQQHYQEQQQQQHYQEPQQQHYQQAQHHYEHLQPKKHIPIVKSESNRNHDGSYNFNYETGNGIHAQEHGYTKNAGHKDHESQVAEGYFSYTGEDGVPVGLKYVADEHGFRAEGSHLPTPPPIPHEIQEALAKLASSPQQHYHDDGDDGQYRPEYHQEQESQYAHQPQAYNQHAGYQQQQQQHQQHQQQQQYYNKY